MNTTTLYLHIPYCKQACHYCDFHFSRQRSPEAAVVKAMHAELATRAQQAPWKGSRINSLYFGGGTPSYLAVADLPNLLQRHKHYFLLIRRQKSLWKSIRTTLHP